MVAVALAIARAHDNAGVVVFSLQRFFIKFPSHLLFSQTGENYVKEAGTPTVAVGRPAGQQTVQSGDFSMASPKACIASFYSKSLEYIERSVKEREVGGLVKFAPVR